MKRLILSASLALMGFAAFAPVAFARQASTPQEISSEATIHDLVLHNRGERNHK
ncbi:MAG: hypothetical protein WBD47_02165 [Phormidesmis sp.]